MSQNLSVFGRLRVWKIIQRGQNCSRHEVYWSYYFKSASSNKIDLQYSFHCDRRKATVTLVYVTSSPHLGKVAPALICLQIIVSCSSGQNEWSLRAQLHEILNILGAHKSMNTSSLLPWLLACRAHLRVVMMELEFLFVMRELSSTLIHYLI